MHTLVTSETFLVSVTDRGASCTCASDSICDVRGAQRTSFSSTLQSFTWFTVQTSFQLITCVCLQQTNGEHSNKQFEPTMFLDACGGGFCCLVCSMATMRNNLEETGGACRKQIWINGGANVRTQLRIDDRLATVHANESNGTEPHARQI